MLIDTFTNKCIHVNSFDYIEMTNKNMALNNDPSLIEPFKQIIIVFLHDFKQIAKKHTHKTHH